MSGQMNAKMDDSTIARLILSSNDGLPLPEFNSPHAPSLLVFALSNGAKLDTIRSICNQYPVQAKKHDIYGRSPLTLAVLSGDEEVALLVHGFAQLPDSAALLGCFHKSMLQLADQLLTITMRPTLQSIILSGGSAKSVEYLLSRDQYPESELHSALLAAASVGNADIIFILRDFGVDPFSAPAVFSSAVASNAGEVLEALVGFNYDEHQEILKQALCEAIELDASAAVSVLASLVPIDDDMRIKIMDKSVETVVAFCKNGAEVSDRAACNDTTLFSELDDESRLEALIWAVVGSAVDLVELILATDVDVNFECKGVSPLSVALQPGRSQVLRILLHAGAEVSVGQAALAACELPYNDLEVLLDSCAVGNYSRMVSNLLTRFELMHESNLQILRKTLGMCLPVAPARAPGFYARHPSYIEDSRVANIFKEFVVVPIRRAAAGDARAVQGQ